MVPYTVEGWSQSNCLECGQTACGKVATTGSQQGHSNPSKHKGIAFIWRIQSTIITNTREPTPRTADYSSASTALHYKVMRSSQKVCCPIHPGKQAAAASSSKQQARSKQAASKQQASSKQASQQASQQAASSSKQQQAAASSSKQQQAAASSSNSKQQASSSKQAATSVCPLERMNKYKL